MNSNEIRKKFLEFFRERGHVIVPSSSLLPSDPSVLFTTAGMQQFKPYYTGKADPMASPHPELGGKPIGSRNAASVQKCFRTSDIDVVGDDSHLTFFEMLGNFSFGGYFKKEAIKWAYDFLVKELGLVIDFVTVFGGGGEIPKDEECAKIWEAMGFSEQKGNLRYAGREDNFWGPTGKEGPCGPTTEIYIRNTEIWNLVFNEYYCKADGTFKKLSTPGVDTGMGLERLSMIVQQTPTIFETDLFSSLIQLLPASLPTYIKRIIADHIRGIVFLLADGVRPSNKETGYVLRRLMRRVLVYEHIYQLTPFSPFELLNIVVRDYAETYPELNPVVLQEEFQKEREKFLKTLGQGLKMLGKVERIDASSAFKLYETFGLPFEIIKELGKERATLLTREAFDEEFKKHQEISRAGMAKKFGGHGLLLDTGELKAGSEEEIEIVTRLHTATHLLQAALRMVLGESVHQAGSDITPERTRFDFTFGRKLTSEEIKKIEDLVNEAIKKDLKMEYKEMPFDEAVKTGALYSPKEKYPAMVKVYTAYDPQGGEVFSRELCGGPHVTHAGEIGRFKIVKEESPGAGMRRIRASVG